MANYSSFWLLKLPSHEMRGELLNVGLLIEQDGKFIVRQGKKLEKVRAISAAFEPSDVAAELDQIQDALTNCDLEKVEQRIATFSFLQCRYQGTFSPGKAELWEHYVSDLMSRYVDPEPSPPKPVRKRPTRLRQEIVRLFRAERILARPSEGLESHRILYKHRFAEGVEADFVLKNGALHVVESVDASTSEVSLQRSLYEIAMSNLTFEHARIGFGNSSVRPRLVYQAPASLEKALTPSLYAVEHQGAELINWADSEARESFIHNFMALAESADERRRPPSLFHASPLPLRKIN